mmetsp:Transcript_16384/g.52094  ORF Transcript_16384/g.52094 Transcript_16384/m.52094 type:complete len:500 (+) Transcript_16384:734-2233(+)
MHVGLHPLGGDVLGVLRLAEARHEILGQVDVLEHALQLGCERCAALVLELLQHALLQVGRRALAQQQSLGQVLLVEGLKHVLAADEPEQVHRAVQQRLHFVLRHALVPRPQLLVHELGDQLGGPVLARVDGLLEGGLDREPHVAVGGERVLEHRVHALLDAEQLLDHDLVLLRVLHHRPHRSHHVARSGPPQRLHCSHAREQTVHAVQILHAVASHEGLEALVQKRLRMHSDQRVLHLPHQRPTRGSVQVEHHPVLLLLQPALSVAEEVRRVALLHLPGALRLVKLARGTQEGPLEGGAVQTQRGEHADEGLEQAAVHHLAAALPLDQRQQARHQLGVHLRQALQRLPKQRETHVPQRLDRRGLNHVGAVQVEEDGAQGGHLGAEAIPHVLDHPQEGRVLRGLALQSREHSAHMRCALGLQPREQTGRHLVDAEVLHRAVQLLPAHRHCLILLHRAHRKPELFPTPLFKILGQLGLHHECLDDELLLRRSGRGALPRRL